MLYLKFFCFSQRYWLGNPKSVNHEQPWPGQEYDTIIRENDAYYIGPR